MVSCLVATSLAVAAFTLASCRFPYYSFQKAFYLLFLTPVFVCFMGMGIKRMAHLAGWSFMAVWLGLLCLVNLSIFSL